VQQAREAADAARGEASRLAREMLANGHEVAETLSQIGSLGNEIQKDINDIVVALQYQDITQQKLQRLKDPLLTDLVGSLRAIFDETRVLSNKLQVSGLVEGASGSAEALRISTAGPANDPAVAPPAAAGDNAATAPQRRKGDDAVEIF
jgi:hypothetical protein